MSWQQCLLETYQKRLGRARASCSPARPSSRNARQSVRWIAAKVAARSNLERRCIGRGHVAIGAAVCVAFGLGHQLIHLVAHQRVFLDEPLGDSDDCLTVLFEQHLDALEVLIEQSIHLAAWTTAAASERTRRAEHSAV